MTLAYIVQGQEPVIDNDHIVIASYFRVKVWWRCVAGLATRRISTMRPMRSPVIHQSKLLVLAISGTWLSLTTGFLPISDHGTSSAFAQSTTSSSRQQAAHERSTVSSHLLSSTTQAQGRRHHSLIRKPASQEPAAVAPSAVLTDITGSSLSEQIPVSTTSTNAAAAQPATSGSLTQTNRTQQSSLAAVSSAAPIAGNTAVQSSLSSASSSTVSGATGLTAAVGGSSGSTTTGSRSLGRLRSEVAGMNQIFTQTGPAIGINPRSFSFTAQQGGSTPPPQTLGISNVGGGSLVWTAASNAAWLTVSPASGSGNDSITLTAATGSLTAGTYDAVISLSATGATSVSVPVTLEVTGTATSITLNPSSLTYSGIQGESNPATESITVTSDGTWTASSNRAWLTVTPTSGSGNGTLTASVNMSAAAVGANTATITVTSGSTTRTVAVSLTVTAASLSLAPSSRTFTATQGGANPADQSVTLTSNGSWTASSNRAWLTVSPTSGSGNGTLTVSANMSAAAVGTNTGTLTVIRGNTTRTVSVTFTVTAASLSLSPTSRTFTATQGGANPADQTVTVTSNGTWTASSNTPWLTITPASGSNNGTLTASVNVSAASLGTNTATITVIGGGLTRTATVTLTVTSSGSASSMTLAWDANSESDLASYRIYRSTTPGVYGAPVATVLAGIVSYQMGGLQAGTYYFTVTAVDSAGNESPRSNEISRVVN